VKLAIVGSRGLHVDIKAFVPKGVTEIISGGAIGVDSCAIAYARKSQLPIRIFKPNYTAFGRAAPIIRNKEIIKAADEILAIWDGFSRGTLHAVEFAKFSGKPTVLFTIVKKIMTEQRFNTKRISLFRILKSCLCDSPSHPPQNSTTIPPILPEPSSVPFDSFVSCVS
jgi:hypothetical protein